MAGSGPSHHRVIVSDDGADAVALLARAAAVPRSLVKEAMHKGAAWLERGTSCQRLRRADRALRHGDTLHLYLDPAVLAEVPPEPLLLADEGSYSVWFKPFGLRAQGSRFGDHCTVHRRVATRFPDRPAFHVHRLDRAATGIVLVAHGKRAAAALAGLFEARAITKHYRVVVHGRFRDEPCTIDTPIDGRTAWSSFTLVHHDAATDRSLLDARIDTGRKHQIRRHLTELGFPVVGDRRYGRAGDAEDLQLTAWSLAFRCPLTGEARGYRLPDELVPSIGTAG